MRAARYHGYGPPDVLVVEDAPEPHAGPGEIRIRAAAASVDPIEWKVRAGGTGDMVSAEFPAIPGRDAPVDSGEGRADWGSPRGLARPRRSSSTERREGPKKAEDGSPPARAAAGQSLRWGSHDLPKASCR
jgi:hypothetical protein